MANEIDLSKLNAYTVTVSVALNLSKFNAYAVLTGTPGVLLSTQYAEAIAATAATAIKLSTQYREVIAATSASAIKFSTQYAEVVANVSNPLVRLSNQYVEVITPLAASPARNRVSTAYDEVISSGSAGKNRISTVYGEVIASGSAGKNRVSTAYREVIADLAPVLNHLAFALADPVETAFFVTSIMPSRNIAFALTDPVETAAISIQARGTRSLAFALTDPVEMAAFVVSAASLSRSVRFTLTDIVETAAFNLSTSTPRHLALSALDIVERAAFRLSSLNPLGLHFALHDITEQPKFALNQTFNPQTTNFPVFPGLGFPVHRRPNWRTIIAPHPSGGERRTALWTYPLWDFELTIDGLSAAKGAFPGVASQSFQELLGFYLAHGGQLTTFLFKDPIFNSQIGASCGTGDGASISFTFMRTIGGATEPASWVVPTPTVYLDGVAQSSSVWQLVPPNNLVFLTAPRGGGAITADFNYLFLVRFAEDNGDYEQMMINLWDMKSLKLRQVRTT